MAIDVGASAAVKNSTYGLGNTIIHLYNPVNANGVLTVFEVYAETNCANTKIGVFSGSGSTRTSRDYESIGSITAGSKQTFTGKNCDAQTNDVLGVYGTGGTIYQQNDGSSGGLGLIYRTPDGDAFTGTSQNFVTTYAAYKLQPSVYLTGVSTAAVTTNAADNVTASGCRGNGNITDTGGSGSDISRRGFCYKAGTSGDPTVADSTAYDDGTFGTGAYTKNISGLSAGSSYRVRAYVINAYGIFYGSTVQVLTLPAAPTNVAASENNSEKVVVTWTKSSGATGYKIYRDGNLIDTVGDVATYDDTGADAPVITPGLAAASDGTQAAHVALSLSGTSIANGTTHTYKIKATNVAGDSSFSSTDTGYRLAGTLTYQWQRSAGDSDALYSNIEGGTTASYNDTGAPSNGDGRFFKCILSATGSSNQTSSADRGYRTALTSPTVTTAAASNVDETSFTGNGEITSTGGANPFRRGFCWIEGAVGDPDVNDSVEDETGDFGTGVFDLSITGLSSETDYRVRAFAENSVGISYSDTIDVTTLSRAIETEACTNVTSESATANATINRSTNAVVRRGFVYRKASSGDPLITDLNATVISEETKSGIDGLVLRKYNGDLEEDGYFTLDDIIDLGAVYTVRAHGILTTTSLNLYDDLYSYTDLFAVLNLYGVNEGKTNVVIEISTTNDDTTADPEWSDWQTFIIGDYSARGFRFRLYAKGLPPDITPIIYSAYIELDMEDRVYSFEETVTAGGITIEFDPPFYAAPHIGISILDAQSGDYYVIDAKDENGFNVEIFNGVTSVERAISGIARGYGMKEV